MNTVTLYVPYYNSADTIGECLDSVMSQTRVPNKIIVLDDASPVPFQTNIKGVEVVRLDENIGLGASRNYVLESCDSSHLAALDADVVADPEWLETLLDTFARKSDAVGGAGRMLERFRSELPDKWRSVHMAQHWGDEPIDNPRFLYGANTIFKTDYLRSIGGYDDQLKTNYEDMTLCEKIYDHGESLFYEPAAYCEHLKKDTVRSVMTGFWRWFHSAGVRNGDFESGESLIERLERVAFGIYRYRFDRDVENGNNDLLELDALVPWVFAYNDLKLFARLNHLREFNWPMNELLERMPRAMRLLYREICPEMDAGDAPEWIPGFTKEFERCIELFNWRKDILNVQTTSSIGS